MYSLEVITSHWKSFYTRTPGISKSTIGPVELDTYNLKFKYIQGIKNTLADTLSWLININPDVELPKEKPGQEFRYNFLEDLTPIEVEEIIVEGVEIKPDPDTFLKDVNLKLQLQPKAIRTLQAQDTKIINLLNRLKVGDLDANVYLVEDGILRCRINGVNG